MDIGHGYTKTFNIEISHLDYKYIETCKNLSELEKIYLTLKMGEEGYYPDLLNFCEKRLQDIAPESRVLRKVEELKTTDQLDQSTQREIKTNYENWLEGITNQSVALHEIIPNNQENIPIRKQMHFNISTGQSKITRKSCKPKNYDEWSKIADDMERELIQEEEQVTKGTKIHQDEDKDKDKDSKLCKTLSMRVDTQGLSEVEKTQMALQEKNKGNEAFRSNDYEEALSYYSRSISIEKSSIVHNNRGLVYMKLQKWKQAISDLNFVLKSDQNNNKALMRRANCLYEIHDLNGCIRDCRASLLLDDNSHAIKTLLEKAEQEVEERKKPKLKDGHRMVITEVDGEDDGDVEPNIDTENGDCRPVREGDDARKRDNKAEESEDNNSNNTRMSKVKLKCGWRVTIQVAEDNVSSSDESTEDDIEITPPPPPPPPRKVVALPPPPPNKPDATDTNWNKWRIMGNKMFEEANYTEALKYYDYMVNNFPNRPIGHRNRALCHIRLGNYAWAVADCTTSIKLDPNSYLAYYRRGKAYKMLDELVKSEQDLKHALYLFPEESQVEDELRDVRSQISYSMVKQSNLSNISANESSADSSNSKHQEPIAAEDNLTDLSNDAALGATLSVVEGVVVDQDDMKTQPELTNEGIPESQSSCSNNDYSANSSWVFLDKASDWSKVSEQSLAQSSSQMNTDTTSQLAHTGGPQKIQSSSDFDKQLSKIHKMTCQDVILMLQSISHPLTENLIKLMSNKLDGMILEKVIHSLLSFIQSKDQQTTECNFIVEVLDSLQKCQRFHIAKMMISDYTLEELEKIFECLQDCMSPDQLKGTRQSYL